MVAQLLDVAVFVGVLAVGAFHLRQQMGVQFGRLVVVAGVHQTPRFLATLRGPDAGVAVRIEVTDGVPVALTGNAAQVGPLVALADVEIAGQVEALEHRAIRQRGAVLQAVDLGALSHRRQAFISQNRVNHLHAIVQALDTEHVVEPIDPGGVAINRDPAPADMNAERGAVATLCEEGRRGFAQQLFGLSVEATDQDIRDLGQVVREVLIGLDPVVKHRIPSAFSVSKKLDSGGKLDS
ncbi:hypothetical protein D9M71_512410 [compost metagenome]